MLKYSLILGGLFAAIGWAIFWPEQEAVTLGGMPQAVRVPRQLSRSPEQLNDLSDLVDRLKDTSDRQTQVSAARELKGLKKSEIQELLLGLKGDFSDVWNVPVSTKLLLVELGRRDPADALAWSWENLREARGWAHAFEQIGPQWAWDDAEGFAQFVKKHLRNDSSGRDFTMMELLAAPEPILGTDEVSEAQLWLSKSSPRAAFQIFRLAGSSRYSTEILDSLKSRSDFVAALSVWDDYDPEEEKIAREAYDEAKAKIDYSVLRSEERDIAQRLHYELSKVSHPSLNHTVKEIVSRWELADPEGFAESQYAIWDLKKE